MIACAHHRLAWIHPFIDGNGRVTRLATHAALYRNFTVGLWSISRGLARTQQEYYTHLEAAEASRQGDYDGRGNLTEKGLWSFCYYFLNTGLVESDTPIGVIRFGLPLDALQFYFPNLYPEANIQLDEEKNL